MNLCFFVLTEIRRGVKRREKCYVVCKIDIIRKDVLIELYAYINTYSYNFKILAFVFIDNDDFLTRSKQKKKIFPNLTFSNDQGKLHLLNMY